MDKKILFWIDMTLIPFGIAKYLQEQFDGDLFAIIDISHYGKSFFQKQTLVNFKKIWLFQELLSEPLKNYDITYLCNFEKMQKSRTSDM